MRPYSPFRFVRVAALTACAVVWLVAIGPAFRIASSAAAPATCQAQSASSQQATSEILLKQSPEQVNQKSDGCVSCHTATDSPTMHTTGTVRLGCTDCHGGNAQRLSRGWRSHVWSGVPGIDPAGTSSAADTGECVELRQSGARLHQMAEGRSRLHQVRKSRAICGWRKKPAAVPAVTQPKYSVSAPA